MTTEKFIDSYTMCTCCKLRLHLYHYPVDKKTKRRDLTKCLACLSQECTAKKCKLGELR